jgi:hypothetical protein
MQPRRDKRVGLWTLQIKKRSDGSLASLGDPRLRTKSVRGVDFEVSGGKRLRSLQSASAILPFPAQASHFTG